MSDHRFDAVLFDLLTALLDSWTLWNNVAGNAEDGRQWRTAYLRRTGTEISPRARQVAAIGISVAEPVVRRLISPEALSDLLTAGWPVTVVPDPPPPGTIGITRSTVGTIWQVFGAAEYGVARFEVSEPVALPSAQRFRLRFQLLQWRWRLVSVTLPEHIQDLLAGEVDFVGLGEDGGEAYATVPGKISICAAREP